jgi:hypothetical protein
VVAFVVIVLGLNAAVTQPVLLVRLSAPLAIGLFVPAGWLLARAVGAPRDGELRVGTLAVGIFTLTALAWALPDPMGTAPWLFRNTWLVVGLTAGSIAGLELLTKWPEGRKFALVVGALAVVLTGVLLGQMVPAFSPVTKRTDLDAVAIIALVLAFVGMIVTAVRLALHGDPLGSSEGVRTMYVYLAELIGLMLFIHLRLNVPELFSGALAKYWTLIVLGVAFAGVGMGEWAMRRGLLVLSVPLMRTGVFLPLVPILAFWARPPKALLAFADDHAPGLQPMLGYLYNLPVEFNKHALIWFLASGLYAMLALARRSVTWALVAALAANFGFWALLMYIGVGFLVHPQAWVIPLALILLFAEYLHREQLPTETSQAMRYLGISMIYVASTADLFLVGLGESLWLPIILACLCVGGVLAGILLRVRAFLFLGIAFLLVDILTMIWHAAVDRAHTWVWAAAGIALGAAILALFAVFEKRRNDVLHLLDELRRWN